MTAQVREAHREEYVDGSAVVGGIGAPTDYPAEE